MDATRPAPRRSYDLRASGMIYVAITVLIALGAFNSQNNLLFWAFSFALAILLVSGLLSGNMLMGINVERTAPTHGTVGRPLTLRYRVQNRSRLSPVFALEVSEQAADGAEGAAVAAVDHVSPRSSVQAEALLRPARRGRLRLESVRVWSAFPFGIIGKVLRFPHAASILIRPEPIEPDSAMLARLDAIGSSGHASAPGPGPGVEFFSLREYVPGDRPRSIAWRASARRDDLLVRQTSPPVPRRAVVLLQLSPGVRADRAESAISRAAGIIEAAAERGIEIGLDIPGAGVRRSPRPGAGTAARLLDELALLDLGSLREAAPGQVPARRRGAATIVVRPEGTASPGMSDGGDA